MSLRIIMPLLAFVCVTGFAAAGGERLVQAPVPGFKIGFQATQKGASIQEQVPAAESVERWSRMVTTQRFEGVAQRITPGEFLQRMGSGLGVSCRGSSVSPIAQLTVSGRPAARMRADCPYNPATDLPETFVALAIAGTPDMHIVQVAFRRVPSAADAKWAQTHLDSVRLCVADKAC